jgi:hypothetical protein
MKTKATVTIAMEDNNYLWKLPLAPTGSECLRSASPRTSFHSNSCFFSLTRISMNWPRIFHELSYTIRIISNYF